MATTDLTIRPFEVHVPDEDLADLRRRIAATRWSGKELVADRSQGVQLATIQALVAYWDPGRTGRAWAELMHRLGYTRYVAQGGDVGAGVCDAMAIQAP